MSLSKIGKTSALTGALSDLLNNKGTLKNVNDSLLSFGNIDIAAAALAKASVGTGLSDANLTAMLQSAYGGTESAANAAGLAMSNALSSVEVAAPEASAAVSGISGAFATTKAAAVGFLSVMKSILPIAAIIGGAFVAGKLAWDNILTNNTVDKNYKNSSDKYDNAKSELTSLQTQYDTNKERIQELNAKQYLSSEERAEKNKLERENQLLDSQVSTGKNVVSASQKQKALDAQKTLDKSSYHKNYAGKQKNKVTDSQKLIYQDDLDQASDMIKQLDSLKSQRDEIINNRSKQSDSYFSAYQKEERKLKWLNEDISQLESDLSDNMSDISKNSESFWDDQGNLVDTTTKKTADRAASVKDVTDPKELAAADKYIQSIMDTMDLSDFDVSNSKHTKDTIISNLKGNSIGPIKSASLINQLFSEYGDDKVAMQAIMKLSLDPSMANADWDTWKSKIEDTKVQIQLDTSAKNLDSLSKELTRLQTDASDQQTRLNNKSAYNMKATASDYTNLIENGDKQIENLNNQIQEYQNSIDALKNSKGISPLSDEDNEQIKQWQDQIQASQMSIENIKASQADWTKTAFNLPVTDMQNTVTGACSDYSDSTNYQGYNGGGSGYVYTSATAANYPSGNYVNSSYYLTNAQTIAGNQSFKSPDGTNETGHTGNGFCRITRKSGKIFVKQNGSWIKV